MALCFYRINRCVLAMETCRRPLDDVDSRIINLLKQNSRMSFMEIGKRIGLSEGAVRRRVKLLVERGVIKRFTIELRKDYVINAVTFLTIDRGDLAEEVIENISKIPEVESVYELTGRFDAMVMISAGGVSSLNECIDKIRRIRGVKHTETAVILRIVEHEAEP
ncbi:MAG: AsnC family transcriptional regulator [Candidatus Wolframiiraptor sp. EX4484-121]|nr:MAG: AsnC family transcriptional regulator [Candidatus Wolframiiraptor sp. EX4484-121]